jgi:hypothetical protein
MEIKNLLQSMPRHVAVAVQARALNMPGGRGLAEGGVIAAQHGIVRSPTYLVGEGTRRTFMGSGAEAVIPLSDDVLGKIGAQMARSAGGDVPARSEGGSGERPMTLTLELDGVTLAKMVTLHQGDNRITLGGRKGRG